MGRLLMKLRLIFGLLGSTWLVVGCGSLVVVGGSGAGGGQTSAVTTGTVSTVATTSSSATSSGSGGVSCGGPVGDMTCGPGEFCEYAVGAMCGAADALGSCAPIPGACPKNLSPVCGCDEVTYGNPCEAESHQVSVLHAGPCTSSNQTCGGLANAQCPAGELCDYELTQHCGSGDQPGHCIARPWSCPPSTDTVCGCDGQTYPSLCDAHAALTAVASNGPCSGG
jgi:hypothetical protein